jgi:prepilin-type N-terminal cleavage/methylation domain-containing protein/prepilin-type processing-associated H-X9-DG protein
MSRTSFPPRPPGRRSPSSRPGRGGFTLIELLVVIAIIAILAAILFPVFAKARDRGRQTACLNNSKQIGTAMTIYMDQWDERFPHQWWEDKWGEYRATPAWQLEPSLKTTQVFVCPSKGRGAPDPKETGFISYGFNGLVTTDRFVDLTGNDGTMNTLEDPVATVVVTETGGCADPARTGGSVGNGACDGAWLDTFWMATSYPKVTAIQHSGSNNNTNHRFQTQHAKHGGTVNVVYADGHAKNTRPSRLTWGNFWGHFKGNYVLNGVKASTPVASQEMDRAEIEP